MDISIESYYDKVTKDIGFSIVNCYSNLEHGVCTEHDCASCSRRKLVEDCYNELSSADKIRVHNEIVKHSVFFKPKKMSRDDKIKYLSILLIIPLTPILIGVSYLIIWLIDFLLWRC